MTDVYTVFKEETCFPAAFATIIRHSGRVRTLVTTDGRIFVSAFTGVCRRVCCDRSSTPPVNKGHARVRNMLIERRKQFAFVWLVKGTDRSSLLAVIRVVFSDPALYPTVPCCKCS
uniref:Proteasome assembly chaperone 3 n=1 Tax=Heterorhabditis bacteriophora TaxID=37862 RepID=A0A1I7WBJ1_HETBA